MSSLVTKTPAAWGLPLFHASIKSQPHDFIVDEVLDIDMQGEGEHVYLHLQKSGMNTDELAQLLEKAYGVGSKDVGLAGLKDRHAITSQWFSVTSPEGCEPLEALLPQISMSGKQVVILKSCRHSRKLRRGAHSGNRFVITLRDVTPLQSDSYSQLAQLLAQRIDSVRQFGFPNYIGEQRFGFGGQNLLRARQWFRQPKKRTSRLQRSLWLSAARSAVFNAVCAKRVEAGNWQSLLPGEPAILDGSRSFFQTDASEGASVTAQLEARLQTFDIHPSAPWWGRGRPPASDECAAFETEVIDKYADLCAGLEKAGLSQERRAIRALAGDIAYQWLDNSTLQLSFHLSPGNFATTLLAQLGVCTESERQSVLVS